MLSSDGGINFKELNKVIKAEKLKVVIVIKSPEKLAEHSRPVILYNILEWMNANNEKKDYELNFIMITRDVRFIDNKEKRVKSRMNASIYFMSRSKPAVVKDILIKRIEQCASKHAGKDVELGKLKKALEQKEIEKIFNHHYEEKTYPISYYLKIMQLVLAINIESEERWLGMTQK